MILSRLEDYDWEQVFYYAQNPMIARESVSGNGFTREDVEEIIFIDDGENDGADWIGVFKLSDGRYAALRAWCDYTGWG